MLVLVFDSALRIRVGGKTRKLGANLGRLDIKICSLAWLKRHSTVAEEQGCKHVAGARQAELG